MNNEYLHLQEQLLEALKNQIETNAKIDRIRELFPAIQQELLSYRSLGTLKEVMFYMTFMLETENFFSDGSEVGFEIMGQLLTRTRLSLEKEYPQIYSADESVVSEEDNDESKTTFSKEDEEWLKTLGKDFPQE